ncbi:hypothetical protein D5086_023317 [Populus alba]|uniref:Uncharacterized protein n=1 Tax=Populus alba TaxID=43335 RepID=A0ACC4BA45_POPAL
MDEAHMLNTCEGYVDWRNRPAVRGRHGGILAASFVLVVEVLENLAFLANASNLVLYLSKFMHFSPSSSANVVTNFMGTAFLLALLGGFLADAFLPTYYIYLISASIESLGLLVLTIQACVTSLKPPPCLSASTSISCEQVDGRKALMLFAGLYLVALGVGGIKGSLPPHGAEQFDENTLQGRKQRSAFFNYYVFCLSCGALIAVTIVVWVEDNKGWQWGFGVSTATILLSIPIFLIGSPVYRTKVPIGSPVTTIFKVLAAAVYKSYKSRDSSNSAIGMDTSRTSYTTETSEGEDRNTKRKEPSQTPTESLEFVNRAVKNKTVNPMLECTAEQVEEVKIVLRIFPIFMSTIMLNCCLAQLSTFSVQQASTMNTDLGSLKVPPASLPVFPVYLFLGSADLFTLAGMMEFFFTEAPKSMRSLATSLSWASLAMGYYLSSVLVSLINTITSKYRDTPWLFGSNLNKYHLERFYWLMCILSGLNLSHYLFWASRYKYKSMRKSLSQPNN